MEAKNRLKVYFSQEMIEDLMDILLSADQTEFQAKYALLEKKLEKERNAEKAERDREEEKNKALADQHMEELIREEERMRVLKVY